jgi:hypothetical protein
MEDIIAIGIGFGATLAWVCFVSWVIARYAFRAEPPMPRAALTAITSACLAAGLGLILPLLVARWLPMLPQSRAAALGALVHYPPAALVDFLLLLGAFRKGWSDEEEYAEPFR